MAAIGDVGVYKFGMQPGVGANREDLLDQIINIDPWDTPWVSQAPKTVARHVYHQWLTDTLGSTVDTLTAIEGNDYAYDNVNSAPTRDYNITVILRQDIGVSETQRAVDPAGFKDAYAYEMQKATKRLAIKLEKIVFSDPSAAGGATASGTSAAQRYMKTFRNFISTNTQGAGTNTNGVVAGGSQITGDATHCGQLSVGDFTDVLELIYRNGGNPEQVYVSPKVKRQMSAFTILGTTGATPHARNIAAVDKKLVSSIDFYDSDFGIIQIVLNRWLPEATNTTTASANATDVKGWAFFLQRSMNRLAWLRPMKHELIGKRGDSVAGIVVGEVTLEVLAEKANGAIKAINNKSAIT